MTGVLVLCPRPLRFLPGAYVQFLRFSGDDRAAPITDSERFEGPVEEAMRDLDSRMLGHIRVAVEIGPAQTETRRANYPLQALREFVRNAVLR